jgi:RND family efflux transporter MFP subunit
MSFQRSLLSVAAGSALTVAGVFPCSVVTAQPGVERPAPARAAQPSGLSRGLDTGLITAFSSVKAVTRPSRDAIMSFTVPTKITEIVVRGGQEVTKGQTIVRGDEAEDRAMLKLQKVRAETDLPVERARKQMELAETEFKIQQEVRAGGGSSDQQLERARLAFEVARIDVSKAQMEQTQEVIQVERLEARVDKFRIEAPFDGIVDNVMLDVGHAASENDKVVRVVNVDRLWIDAPAPTQDPVTLALKVGDKAWVLVDMAGSPVVREGTVIEVAPTADAASRTRRVRVEVENPKGPQRLLAGEPSYVRFTPPGDEFRRLVETTAASAGR